VDRIENSKTGLLDELFYVDIPKEVYIEAFENKEFFLKNLELFPFHENTCPVSQKFPEAYLNKSDQNKKTHIKPCKLLEPGILKCHTSELMVCL
jgi:hypothetical protein